MKKSEIVRRVTLPGGTSSVEGAGSDKAETSSSPAAPPTPIASLVVPQTPLSSSGRLYPTAASFRIWFNHLRDVFGLQFLVLVSMVYFVQGFGSFSGLAVSFLMKDTLHLQPVESQAILTTAAFPWSIKPVFGILSDSLPLCGYRRKSYLIGINLLGCLATFLLHDVQAGTSPSWLTLLLLCTRLATAMSDVIIDALVVERARLDPLNGANDLQSLTWSVMAVGGILGSLLAGPATSHLGPHSVFILAAMAPCIVLGLATLMQEDRCDRLSRGCSNLAKDQVKLVWTTLKVPVIWKSVVFMFVSQACTPSFDQIQFYYAVEVLQFTPEFLGNVGALGFVFLLVGTLVYNTWFKAMPFRAILMRAQICLAVVSISEVLLVTRTNLKMGISDGWFVLLESMFGEVVGRLIGMPVLVLCAKLCPRGIEGTFFALLMANMNLSYTVSGYWGAILAEWLGIASQKYDLLWVAILIRSTMMLLPLGFLWMLPADDPAEEVEAATHHTVVPATDDADFRATINDDDDAGMLGGKQQRSDL